MFNIGDKVKLVNTRCCSMPSKSLNFIGHIVEVYPSIKFVLPLYSGKVTWNGCERCLVANLDSKDYRKVCWPEE